MNILDNYGTVLLEQHEGNRQIASALTKSAQASVWRLAKFLVAVSRHGLKEFPPG